MGKFMKDGDYWKLVLSVSVSWSICLLYLLYGFHSFSLSCIAIKRILLLIRWTTWSVRPIILEGKTYPSDGKITCTLVVWFVVILTILIVSVDTL